VKVQFGPRFKKETSSYWQPEIMEKWKRSWMARKLGDTESEISTIFWSVVITRMHIKIQKNLLKYGLKISMSIGYKSNLISAQRSATVNQWAPWYPQEGFWGPSRISGYLALNMETVWFFLSQLWYLLTSSHGSSTQKTNIDILTAMTTSDLTFIKFYRTSWSSG
jgi:hypothetical protein